MVDGLEVEARVVHVRFGKQAFIFVPLPLVVLTLLLAAALFRPRRTLRKPPPVPPPNVPLPPPPTSVATTHRRPLVHRAHTAENLSATCLAPPFELMDNLKIAAAMGTTPPSSSPLTELSAFWGSGARANEN